MSKPQSAEPTMEDILASIRKMISEERVGPRPVPDQMSRTPFGEASAAEREVPVARAAEPTLEPRHEPRSEVQPQLHSPLQLEPDTQVAPAAEAPSVPSFSSLSDALKAAAKPSPQHRSLDEKIADMLDKGPAAPAQSVTVDPLAVFAASRTARQAPGSSDNARAQSRPERSMTTGLKPGPTERIGRDDLTSIPADRASLGPHAGLNGSATSHTGPKPAAEPGVVVSMTSDMPSGRREMPSSRPASGPETTPRTATGTPAAAEKKPDDTTVISIPARGTDAPAFGQNGVAPPKGGGLNGATVAPFGPRPLPGSTGVPRADATGPALKEPVEENKDPLQPSLEDIAKAMRPDLTAPATPPKSGTNFNFLGETPPDDDEAAKPGSVKAAKGPPPSTVEDLVAKIAASHAAESAARMLREKGGDGRGPAAKPDASKPDAAKSDLARPGLGKSDFSRPDLSRGGLAKTEPMRADAPNAAPTPGGEAAGPGRVADAEATKAKGGPSEALLDAVVDLVHSEPSSLSVFASGSAFINGVAEDASFAGPGTELTAKNPRKLDRAASELLRPMLRQWLAENMPRIVEEALRSELDNTHEPDPGTKKS
jgi:cell pole-organizing protein PopZ